MTDSNQTPSNPQIALLFPGQGSQFVGMGHALYDTIPAARSVFEEADSALGFPLSKLIFEGPEEDLKLTENTQPAILTVSIAALRALEPELKAHNLTVAFAAGHSLGEYSAHVASGTFTFADAVRTVKARGRFMQEAVPPGAGAMAAILGLAAERINDICAKVSDELSPPPADPANPSAQAATAIDALNNPDHPAETAIQAAASVAPVVQPANLNSPEQTVISGSKAAVERAAALCKEAGAKRAIMLPVSAPFHCKLMQPAEEQLANTLESIQFNDPAFPVAANVDARLLHRGPEVRDALIRQVTGAVRWVECIQLLKDSGATRFIEVGPGKVLQGLNHKIDKSLVTTHVESPETLAKAMAIFNT
jgi:[acyl-carrier-protein] S-malonyltransferase